MGSDEVDPPEGGPAPVGPGGPLPGPGRTAQPVMPRWAAVALDDGGAPAAAPAPPVAASAAEAVAAARAASPPPPAAVVARRAAGVDRAVVLGALAAVVLAGAWATRLLPEWEDGRWWLLEAIGVGLAGLLAVVGLGSAVAALGEVRRAQGARTGAVAGAVGLGFAGLVVVGAGSLGGHDWTALDVPAAWDRLELGPAEDAEPVTGQAPEGPWLLREYVEVGDCFLGPTDRPQEQVRCADPHRTEVVGLVTLTPEDDEYPGEQALVDVTLPRCRDELADLPRGPDAADDVLVVIPSSRQWRSGDRKAACVLVNSTPVRGSRVG